MLSREEDGWPRGLVAQLPRLSPTARGLPDGTSVRVDALEITTVVPLHEALDANQVLTLAARVSAAAGSPWGSVFPRTSKASEADGAFNGLWAAASVAGVRYTLGPP